MTAATETDRIHKVTMPKWGLSMESGKVTEWLVAEGDNLSQGQQICEIDTDKIAGELESTWSGVVRALVVGVNEDVPVGGTIAIVAAADVPQEEIDVAVTQARAQLVSGAIEDDSGPTLATVDVGGRSISYELLGDPGSAEIPVVFVHGWAGQELLAVRAGTGGRRPCDLRTRPAGSRRIEQGRR